MQAIVHARSVLLSSSLKTRIIRGSFWSFIGSVISYGMTFLASLACAQLLGKTGFGELSMIRNTVSTVGIFAGLGLGLTATKHVAEYREKDSVRTARIIKLCLWTAFFSGVVVTLALGVGSSFIATNILAAPHLSISLIIGAFLIFVYAYDGTQKGILAGFEAYRRTAFIHIIGGVLTFVMAVAGAWFFGVNGVLGGFLVSASVMLLLNNIAIRVESKQYNIPQQVNNVWSEHKMLTSFSLPAFMSSMLVGGAIWITNTMLVNQPNGYDQMGIIGVANNITMLAMFVPNATLQVLLPVLAMELNKDAQTKTNNRLLILNSYTAFFLTSSFISLILYFVPAILRLYGADFSDGQVAIVFVLCSLPILTYKDGIARLIQAKSLMWFAYVSNMVWAIFLVGGYYLLIDYGATGIALATLCAYTLNSLIFVPIYYRKLDMGRQLQHDAYLATILVLAIIPGVLSNFLSLDFKWLIIMLALTVGFVCVSLLLIWRCYHEQ